MKKQITKIQMRWGDIDQFGHVYNGYYQHFYDLGKTDYIVKVLGIDSRWAECGDGFLTVQTTTNYYKPVTMSTDLECHTVVEKIGTKSLTMYQELRIGSDVYSDSRTVLVCFNSHTNATHSVPSSIRTACKL